MINQQELNLLIEAASTWIEEQEAYILENGTPLNQAIIDNAQNLLPIKDIKNVRVMVVDKIPLPTNDILRNAMTQFGFIGENSNGIAFGLSCRYGIFLNTSSRDNTKILIHELTHTMQYERAGGIRPFLQQYIQECIEPGYPLGSLEQEAINVCNKV